MTSYLISGPIMLTCDRRRELVQQMAADLIVLGPFADDDDALSSLVGCYKYRPTHIMECFEAAKYEASQMMVAKEMSDV